MNFEDHSLFLDELATGAYRTTVDGRFVYANVAMATLLGFHSVQDLSEVNARFLYQDEAERERWQEDLEASATGTLTRDANWRKKNWQPIRVLEAARVIREAGKVVAYEGVVFNVTDRLTPLRPVNPRLLEQSAIHHRKQDAIDHVLDLLPICVSRKDRDRNVIWANQIFCKVENVSLEDLLSTRNSDAKLYGKELDDVYGRGDDAVFQSGRPIQGREPHRYGDGSVRDVEVLKIPLFADDGVTVNGVEVYFWDNVTLATPLRDFIRSSRIHELFRSTETAIYEQDLDGNYLYVSPSAIELLGYPDISAGELNMANVIAPEYLEIARSQIRKKLDDPDRLEAATTYEIELVGALGKRIPVEVNSRLNFRNGKACGVVGYIRDLSAERRRLSEVHHRVKNNLHTINALLHREERGTDNAEVIAILRDCRSRIDAIADLHEQLYKTKRIDHVAVDEYVPELVKKLATTYAQPWQDIDVRVAVEPDMFLSLDAMIPCTLVLQELLSNAIKHAFPRKDRVARGSIMVALERTGRNDEYRLQLSDTGVGLPSQADLAKSKSLGMSLVKGLVTDQLKGTIQTPKSPKGAYFVVEFRDPSPISSRRLR